MYDARQIANWFVERAKSNSRRLSIMQLLKLIYIAHGWHLELTAGAPLVKNKIEAWKHGPVIPDVYNSFRPQGIDIGKTDPRFSTDIDSFAAHVLEYVYETYGRIPASRLSDMTHVPGGPWHIASEQLGYFAPISNDLILPHYQMLRARYQQAHNG